MPPLAAPELGRTGEQAKKGPPRRRLANGAWRVVSATTTMSTPAPARISLFIATSLDGLVARPDGAVDWLFTDADYGYAAFFASVTHLALGRQTFAQVQSWGEWPYPGKPATVFSRQPRPVGLPPEVAEWTATAPAIWAARWRAQHPGGHLWLVGGPALSAAFRKAGAIDELVLSVHPRVLGAGRPLWMPDLPERPLTLLAHQVFPNGLVQLHYAFARG